MVFWSPVRAERWATRPSAVARVTRCMRSSSWRRLRQVSPVRGFGDADEQQCQPAQLDVGADAVLAVVVDRAQPEAALAVAPAAFDGEQLLVGGGQVLGGQGEVGGAQQPLAVVVGFPCGGGAVDAQQPGLGAAQQPAQPGLVAAGSRRTRRACVFGQASEPSIRPSQVLDEPLAHGCVAGGGVGVVAHHEPFGARPVGCRRRRVRPGLL